LSKVLRLPTLFEDCLIEIEVDSNDKIIDNTNPNFIVNKIGNDWFAISPKVNKYLEWKINQMLDKYSKARKK